MGGLQCILICRGVLCFPTPGHARRINSPSILLVSTALPRVLNSRGKNCIHSIRDSLYCSLNCLRWPRSDCTGTRGVVLIFQSQFPNPVLKIMKYRWLRVDTSFLECQLLPSNTRAISETAEHAWSGNRGGPGCVYAQVQYLGRIVLTCVFMLGKCPNKRQVFSAPQNRGLPAGHAGQIVHL